MVESVRGRNKEQRARLLLGYQVADSVSKLHPLIHPRIWYLSSMGRKILWLIADFEPKNSCGVGWGELAGFLDNRGQAAAGGSARDLTVSRSRIFAPKTHLPLNHPPAPQPGLSERRKIFFIRFVDCCHAKQLRGG